MLDDKLLDYISTVKSPFENDEVSQEELEFRGYLRYCKDCIIKSVGTNECLTQINLYFTELKTNLTESEYNQFLIDLISAIVKQYGMTYLSNYLLQKDVTIIDNDIKEKFIMFMEHNGYFTYLSKCLSQLPESILRNESKIKVFIDADYDSFVIKLNSYKKVHPWIKDYFYCCSRQDGIETLYLLLKKDLLGLLIEQNSKSKKD